MRRQYKQPQIKVLECKLQHLICDSFGKFDDEANGNESLIGADNDWDEDGEWK